MKTRAERIADVVTMMGEAWRQKITPATMLTFSAGTDDLPIESVERAAMRAIRECQFMPSVFELRQLAGAKSENVAAKDKPTLAWGDVRRAINRVGAYDSPKFDDPVIHATIRQLGGWVALCDSTAEELVWREKDFLRTYATLAPLELPDEQVARLTGIAERENGPAIPVNVVEVGCLTCGTSGEQRLVEGLDPKRLTAPPAAEVLAKRLTFDDRDDVTDLAPVGKRSRDEQLNALRAMTARQA